MTQWLMPNIDHCGGLISVDRGSLPWLIA